MITFRPTKLEARITTKARARGMKLNVDWWGVALTVTVSFPLFELPGPPDPPSVVPRTIEFWLIEELNEAAGSLPC